MQEGLKEVLIPEEWFAHHDIKRHVELVVEPPIDGVQTVKVLLHTEGLAICILKLKAKELELVDDWTWAD